MSATTIPDGIPKEEESFFWDEWLFHRRVGYSSEDATWLAKVTIDGMLAEEKI
jgi:hypothetical protein